MIFLIGLFLFLVGYLIWDIRYKVYNIDDYASISFVVMTLIGLVMIMISIITTMYKEGVFSRIIEHMV